MPIEAGFRKEIVSEAVTLTRIRFAEKIQDLFRSRAEEEPGEHPITNHGAPTRGVRRPVRR